MNKIYTLIVIGSLIAGLFLFSCRNESSTSETNEQHLAKLDTIRDLYNSKREPHDWTAITNGKIKIIVDAKMISIHHTPDTGNVSIIYFLQTGNQNHDLRTDSFGMSEVLFLGRNLIIHLPDKRKTFLFSVIDETVPIYLHGFTDVKKYVGYGLGVRKFIKGGLAENVPFCQCEPLGTPDSDCNRGGNEAHGCGTGTPDGSCEVSCSMAAFACCDKKIE
jgi:hypothetical protein